MIRCTDAEPGLSASLQFDPCYLKPVTTVFIPYCNYRVGTFGCLVSATMCSFLAIIFSVWALRHRRNPHYTWGNYFFCALTHFVSCLFSLIFR